MRQHDLPEKIKYLSMAAEILNKIAKPQEYYYFSRQRWVMIQIFCIIVQIVSILYYLFY